MMDDVGSDDGVIEDGADRDRRRWRGCRDYAVKDDGVDRCHFSNFNFFKIM